MQHVESAKRGSARISAGEIQMIARAVLLAVLLAAAGVGAHADSREYGKPGITPGFYFAQKVSSPLGARLA